MQPLPEIITRRFHELETQVRTIRMQRTEAEDPIADPEQFYSWSTSAMYAIQAAFGAESSHSVAFDRELNKIQNNLVWSRHFESIRGVFLGAKADVDGGYIYELQRALAGELFGDLVALAKAALAAGHHTVASVLACAALEDALKRYAISKGLQVEGQTMDEVVNGLKSKALVSGAQKTLLAAMPKLRNAAMHADWDKITPQDAGSAIGFVEQFLLAHF